MKKHHLFIILNTVYLFFLFAHPVYSQESEQTTKQKKSSGSRLDTRLNDQDVILPISSIEWGTPDRWSFTSRYIHMFEKDRDNKTWLNNLSITLSPGTAGGRFAIGYQGILSPRSIPEDIDIFSESRVVLLRTWGNPLSTITNRTFVGAEIRGSLSFLINIGIGYYKQISNSNSRREHFYGLHVGFGI